MMLWVNGELLPTPSKVDIYRTILTTEAGRSPITGVLYATEIARKIKLEVNWQYLTDAEFKQILEITDKSFFFNLRYQDGANLREIEAYRGDVKAGLQTFRKGQWVWIDVSISFIER